MTELDTSPAGSRRAPGTACVNTCSRGLVSRMAALNKATSGTVEGWNGVAASWSK